MRDRQHELGMCFPFIAHNIGVVEHIDDRFAVMRAGHIKEQGACDELLSRPRRGYTHTLLAAVPGLAAG